MDLATVATSIAPRSDVPEASDVGVTQELRLALAMRGGLSLAVWIGGAVAEIEWLRRSGAGAGGGAGDEGRPAGGHPAYRALLELAGYHGVLVDVLAGASAGGLNGAVYAAAQRHGFDVAKMRDLWLSLGDIEALTRATTSAGRAAESMRTDDGERRLEALRPPSLLDGDGYFYPRLRATIDALIASAARDRIPTADRVDLLLSATLFTPGKVRVRLNRLTTVIDTGASALFRFRRDSVGDDLGDGDAPGSAARRLAMAARSTSSFPVLFEPARIHVGAGADPDFRGVFEAPGDAPVGEWRVVDGGVLDNIPVAAAIGAVVAAPADGPTERWLLYLHPSPPVDSEQVAPAAGPLAPLGSPRAFATGLRALGTTAGQESLLGDIRELEAVNHRARRRRLATAEAFAAFRPHEGDVAGQLQEACRRSAAAATEIRLQLDVEHVLAVLRRPPNADAVAAGLTTTLPLSRWSAQEELTLPEVLHQTMGAGPDEEPWRSPTALRDLIRLLIAWASLVERVAGNQVASPASVAKAAAYRLGQVAAALAGHHRQAWLRAAAARAPDQAAGTDLQQWAARTWSTLPRHVPPGVADEVAGAVHNDSATAEVVAVIASELGGDGTDLAATIWQVGLGLAGDLRTASLAQPTRPGHGAAPFHLLEAVPPDQLDAAVASVLSIGAAVDLVGATSDTEIRLAQITGGASTPLDCRFERLKELRHREEGVAPAKALRPADKLCGDQLGNCAAFLSARWRANDWMWGRLDAASTLVSLLLDPDRLAARRRTLGDDEFVRLARAALTSGLPDGWAPNGGEAGVAGALADAGVHPDPAAWGDAVRALCERVTKRVQWEILAAELPVVDGVGHEPPTDVPRPRPRPREDVVEEVRRYDVGRQAVRDLGDERRVRIFLRLALVAFGVLRPDGRSPAAVVGRWAVSALKPAYLVVVLLAASPRRGAFALAAALASLQATYWRSTANMLGSLPGWWWWAAPAVAGTSVVAGRLLRGSPSRRASEAASAVTVIGCLALATALLTWLWPSGARWTVLSVLALALATVAIVRWVTERRRPGAALVATGRLWYPATAVAAGAGVAAGLVDWGLFSSDFADRFLLLTAVAVVVTVATTGWMRPGHRGLVVVLTAGVYTATAGPFLPQRPPWASAAVAVAGGTVAALLAFLVASDGWRRRRVDRTNSGRQGAAAAVAVAAVVAAAWVAAWLATSHVRWSDSVWLLLAVPGSIYAFTVAATFADVLPSRPSRSSPPSPPGPGDVLSSVSPRTQVS